jgi:hypothetical protein
MDSTPLAVCTVEATRTFAVIGTRRPGGPRFALGLARRLCRGGQVMAASAALKQRHSPPPCPMPSNDSEVGGRCSIRLSWAFKSASSRGILRAS